ncbi:MAG: DNA polymerase III subunit gamma/tau [Kiritimatiellia bacterium]
MAYEVLARKWRPQQFDDVVGQRHVTDTLKNAIKTKRIAHAYLFVGPRGIGKTTSARIFAKALNCEKGPTDKPCDQCDSCKEIMAGRSLDVIEIDGASNRGIEHIRNLRENVCYAPARGPYKIYIIDEVHMLTSESFNALLKTLEEPPPHVKFVFATTEPHKILPTILSRCQRFDLLPIPNQEMIAHLRMIAKAEKIDIDEDALLAIARGAEGGLRDAESSLDQLVSFCGSKIREPDVMSVFGLVSRQTLETLVDAVLAGDISAVVKQVADLADSGKDMRRVVHELLEYFRNILVYHASKGSAEVLGIGPAQLEAVKRQAERAGPDRILQVIEILTDTAFRLRDALSRRTLLEIALIRCSRAATAVSIDSILAQIASLKENLSGGVSAAGDDEKKKPPEQPAAVKETPRPASAAPSPKEPAGIETLAARWHEIVENVAQHAPMTRGYLLDAKPVRLENGTLIIGFDPEFAAEKDQIVLPRNVNAIKRVAGEFLGREVHVEFEVLEKRVTLPADTQLKASACKNDEPPVSEPGQKKTVRSNMTPAAKQKWTRDPAVVLALETFGGDIVDIRE